MTETVKQLAGSVAASITSLAGALAAFHPARLLLWLIRAYQRIISPLCRPCCRFVPSCSEYAAQAVEKHGALKGTWKAFRRLMRCHPFSAGGYDPP